MLSASMDWRAVQMPIPVMATKNSMTTTRATPRSCALVALRALTTDFIKYRIAHTSIMLLHIVAQAEFFDMPGNGVPGGLDSLFIVAIAVCAHPRCARRARCAWQARIAANGARQQANAHRNHILPTLRGIATDFCCRKKLHTRSVMNTVSKLQIFQSCHDG